METITAMRTRFAPVLALLAALLILPVSTQAQTALNETTLAAAVTSSANTIRLTSATGIADGYGIYIENEFMTVAASWTSGTTIPVIRRDGAVSHAALTPVLIGPAPAFIARDRSGSCAATSEQYLPQVNVTNGKIFDCGANVEKWINLRDLVVVSCQTGALATGSVDQSCFTANRPYLVYKINYVAKVAEAGGTLTLIPRRQQSTEAPASGDALATALNVVTTGTAAETVATFTLTTTEADLMLMTGDRLGLDFTDDVAGELLGVIVTFFLYPL